MRSLLALSAVMAASAQSYGAEGEFEAPAASSSQPHLTSTGTWEFITDSISLTKDLSIFISGSIFSLGWDVIPKDTQKQIQKQYDAQMKAIDSFRIQNGIPSNKQIWSEIQTPYKKIVQPQIDTVFQIIDTSIAPIAKKHIEPFIAKFEKAYPAQKGKISSHIIDFALIIGFLFYFIFAYMWSFVCTILCCGCCKSKKAKGVELKKPAKQPVPAGKKKN